MPVERRIPPDHPLRAMRKLTDAALGGSLSPAPTENPRIGWSAIMIIRGAVPVIVHLVEFGSAPSGANFN